jgi:hypothetical protein
MKSKLFEKPSNAWTPTLTIKSVGMIALAWLIFKHLSKHKKLLIKYSKPSWYFGVAGGNFNNLSWINTTKLSFTSPKTFHDGLELDFSLHRF